MRKQGQAISRRRCHSFDFWTLQRTSHGDSGSLTTRLIRYRRSRESQEMIDGAQKQTMNPSRMTCVAFGSVLAYPQVIPCCECSVETQATVHASSSACVLFSSAFARQLSAIPSSGAAHCCRDRRASSARECSAASASAATTSAPRATLPKRQHRRRNRPIPRRRRRRGRAAMATRTGTRERAAARRHPLLLRCSSSLRATRPSRATDFSPPSATSPSVAGNVHWRALARRQPRAPSCGSATQKQNVTF